MGLALDKPSASLELRVWDRSSALMDDVVAIKGDEAMYALGKAGYIWGVVESGLVLSAA